MSERVSVCVCVCVLRPLCSRREEASLGGSRQRPLHRGLGLAEGGEAGHHEGPQGQDFLALLEPQFGGPAGHGGHQTHKVLETSW